MLKIFKSSPRTNKVLVKLSDSLMKDLTDIRELNLNKEQATLICKHANQVIRAENEIRQDLRSQERIDRHSKQLYLDYAKAGIEYPE